MWELDVCDRYGEDCEGVFVVVKVLGEDFGYDDLYGVVEEDGVVGWV